MATLANLTLSLTSGPAEPSPATSLAMAAAPWGGDLTARLRTLLHAEPLFAMRRNDGMVGAAMRHYDSLTLTFRVLDLIIGSMGLEDELDERGVRQALTPLLVAMDQSAGIAPDPVRHDDVVARLLGRLRNDDARRERFTVPYTDVAADGSVVTRGLEFHLLYDKHAADGRIVLRATDEAVNLYLNALGHDLADAQAAAEAVVQSQIHRGHFDDAVRSAETALVRSRRYVEHLTRTLEITKRDIRQVDWAAEMPRVLKDALQHLTLRLRVERDIREMADDQLNHLHLGTPEAQKVARIIDVIDQCYRRHSDLHRTIMIAPTTFLDAQAAQAFVPMRALIYPELRTAVLTPLLHAPARRASLIAVRALAACHPAHAPGIFAVPDLVTWLLRPRREPPPEIAIESPRELRVIGQDPPRFPPEVRAAARRILATLPGPTVLSTILEGVDSWTPSAVHECLVLDVLQAYAPDTEVARLVTVTRTGRRFQCGLFSGDELLISPTGRGLASSPTATTLASAAPTTTAPPSGSAVAPSGAGPGVRASSRRPAR